MTVSPRRMNATGSVRRVFWLVRRRWMPDLPSALVRSAFALWLSALISSSGPRFRSVPHAYVRWSDEKPGLVLPPRRPQYWPVQTQPLIGLRSRCRSPLVNVMLRSGRSSCARRSWLRCVRPFVSCAQSWRPSPRPSTAMKWLEPSNGCGSRHLKPRRWRSSESMPRPSLPSTDPTCSCRHHRLHPATRSIRTPRSRRPTRTTETSRRRGSAPRRSNSTCWERSTLWHSRSSAHWRSVISSSMSSLMISSVPGLTCSASSRMSMSGFSRCLPRHMRTSSVNSSLPSVGSSPVGRGG